MSWLPGTANGGAGAEIRAGAGRAEALLRGPARVRRAEALLRDRAEELTDQPGRGLVIPSGRDGWAASPGRPPPAHGGLGCPDRLWRESSDFRKFEAKLHQPQSLPWQVVEGAATSVSTR